MSHTPEKSPTTVRGILKKKSPGMAPTTPNSMPSISPPKAVQWDAQNFASIALEKALDPYGTMKIDEPETPFARGSPHDSSGDEHSPRVMPLSPPNPLSVSPPGPAMPSEWDSPALASSTPPSRRRRSTGFMVPPGSPVPEDGATPPRPGETVEEAALRHEHFVAARRRHYNEYRVAQQFQSLMVERTRVTRQREAEDSATREHPHKGPLASGAHAPAEGAAVVVIDEAAGVGEGEVAAVSAAAACLAGAHPADREAPSASPGGPGRPTPGAARSCVLDTPPRPAGPPVGSHQERASAGDVIDVEEEVDTDSSERQAAGAPAGGLPDEEEEGACAEEEECDPEQ